MELSRCCDSPKVFSDICADCKEHADFYDDKNEKMGTVRLVLELNMSKVPTDYTEDQLNNWLSNQFGFGSIKPNNPIWQPDSGIPDMRDAVVVYRVEKKPEEVYKSSR